MTDDGAGMPPEVLARVIEPFFTTKGTGKGTGIGLAMTRGFAEQSSGGLHIESSPGQGMRVTLWLPLAPGAASDAAQDEEELPGMRARKVRVLLVDDDLIVRETTAEELRAEGFTVLPLAEGEAAIRLLDEGERVGIIVSDLSMPGMDGLSVIRDAQRRRPELPAILLTGYATRAAELAMEGVGGGSFTLLRKPTSGPQLAACIGALLEKALAAGD
ncbi:response regulator [Roseomonas sp. GCM10028921]